jgi:FeS assembly SUF system protein
MTRLNVMNKRDEIASYKPSYGNDPAPLEQNLKKQPEYEELFESILNTLREIFDPELPVNIVDLGLIYGLSMKTNEHLVIQMTLTAPNCPVAQSLPEQIKNKALTLAEIDEVELELTWNPPWNPSMMSEAAQLELNL